MDNQPTPQPLPKKLSKFLTRKNIFLFFILIICVELVWAGWTLFKGGTATSLISIPQIPARQPQIPTRLALSVPKTTLKVGEKVTVDINLSSDKKIIGTDLVIMYDPKLLSAEQVVVGTIFANYPQNNVDNTAGVITMSGIADLTKGALADGLFGQVIFEAKAAGLGNVKLDFTAGKTTDSNVIEAGTGADILDQVNNLEINIIQ